MALLAFWEAPYTEYGEVNQYRIYRQEGGSGSYEEIAVIDAFDGYGEWITHYLDTGTSTAGTMYYVDYLVAGKAVAESTPEAGETPLAIDLDTCLELAQGLPRNFVDGRHAYTWAKWAIEDFEGKTRMKLSPTTVTKEVHNYKVYEKILGYKRGNLIRLRHKPIISVDNVYYKIRGAAIGNQEREWTDLDIQIEYNGDPSGYNPGVITIVPRTSSLSVGSQTLIYDAARSRNMINILFTYTHGFASLPLMVEEGIAKYVGAQLMEIYGQAETAGLSSRSIDAYSESYTASATTTQFSALRIEYLKQYNEMLKHWRKPLVAFA